MNKDITTLYDVLLDNQGKSTNEVIRALEKAIAKIQPYNHEEENVRKACNIELNDVDTSILRSDEIDKVSKEIEAIENLFTKREAVYMLAGIQKKIRDMEKIGSFLGKLKGLLDE